ncbi:DNA/RNA non-specific endonuclease [uncultured Cohaesibacter sp.]|uniref:DNA/RNA non-specific endonuclease n=1 Tax=uncultured Cohaesibacter sp. TaxID=1002546 RepID=UPI0029C86F22|nr:DNA/RNA non-specific endonuclease [uncultured Cohaesibacter sp.]
MMRKIGLYFAGLLAAVIASVALARADCLDVVLGGEAPRLEIDQKICHPGFTIGYSVRLRSPLWSAERVTIDQLDEAEAYARNCSIGPSRAVEDGATNADYLHSGFDRGHMTPAGDFGADQQLTCGLANMVPQIPELNRRVWRAIEAQTRTLAEAHGRAFVLTGPIYSGAPAYLSERIPIPESVYKIVITPVGAWAYVATNSLPISCRLISIAQLEAQRGVRLVPSLDEGRRAQSWMPEPVKGCVLWEGG